MAKVSAAVQMDTVEDVYVLLGTSDSSVRSLDLLSRNSGGKSGVVDHQIVRCVEVGLG